MVNAGFEYVSSLGLKAHLKGRYVRYYVSQTSALNRDYFILDGRVGYEFYGLPILSGEVYLNLANALTGNTKLSKATRCLSDP